MVPWSGPEKLKFLHRFREGRKAGGAAGFPFFESLQIHHFAVVRVVITHGKKYAQPGGFGFRREILTYRENTVIKLVGGGQDFEFGGIDGAILGPSLPVQIDQCAGRRR